MLTESPRDGTRSKLRSARDSVSAEPRSSASGGAPPHSRMNVASESIGSSALKLRMRSSAAKKTDLPTACAVISGSSRSSRSAAHPSPRS
jgi:hypothetical protein